MDERVVIYRLTHKFVSQEPEAAEGPRQVIYYSLAIGHHVGVMDCLQPLIEMPLDSYRGWLQRLPEGAGRSKLEGLLKWGEIEVGRHHVESLLPALREARPDLEAAAEETQTLIDCLEQMLREPALYLMIRKCA
jgi:hypothetical protein